MRCSSPLKIRKRLVRLWSKRGIHLEVMETQGYLCDIQTKKMETHMCDIHTKIMETLIIFVWHSHKKSGKVPTEKIK